MAPPLVFDCTETVQRLWDFIDRELPPAAGDAVRAHVAQCDACHEHLQYLTRFLEHVRAAPVDDHAVGRLQQRVSIALREAAAAGD
jgi:anti-sigma factor RsiW